MLGLSKPKAFLVHFLVYSLDLQRLIYLNTNLDFWLRVQVQLTDMWQRS